jgi:hypothetical protein
MSYATLQQELDVKTSNLPPIQRLLIMTLRKYVPRRFKRMIFLSSIVGAVKDIKNPDKATLDKLNHLLHLAHNNNAIAFPMYIHSWLWKQPICTQRIQLQSTEVSIKDIGKSVLNRLDVVCLAKYFIENAPLWLIYSTDRLIAKDLEIAIRDFIQPGKDIAIA